MLWQVICEEYNIATESLNLVVDMAICSCSTLFPSIDFIFFLNFGYLSSVFVMLPSFIFLPASTVCPSHCTDSLPLIFSCWRHIVEALSGFIWLSCHHIILAINRALRDTIFIPLFRCVADYSCSIISSGKLCRIQK